MTRQDGRARDVDSKPPATNETLLHHIVENIPDMIFVKDAKARFVRFNRAGEELLGYQREELIGRTDHDLFPKEEADYFTTRDREVLAGKKLVDVLEEPIHTQAHGLRYLHTKTIPILDEAGEPIYLLGISRDVTEQRNAREAILQKVATIDLLRHVAVAANMANTVDRAMEVALEEVCAYTRWPVGHVYLTREDPASGLVSTKLWHFDEPEKFDHFRAAMEGVELAAGVGLPGRVLASGAPSWTPEVGHDVNVPQLQLAREMGVRASFAFPVLIGLQVVGVLEFFSEEARQPEPALLALMADVGAILGRVVERQRASDFQRQITAIVGHDLRNPLAVIFNSCMLLRTQEGAPPMVGDVAKRIMRIAGRMNRIIGDLFDTTVAQTTGTLPILPTPVDIDAVCRELLTEFEASHPNRTITYTSTGDVSFTGDPDRLRQMLQNLVANALAHGRADGQVRLAWHSTDDELRIEVANGGEAIDPEVLPFIFERFRRGSSRSTGLGLGLFIVQTIVRAHGGQIAVTSTAEETCFSVRLPRR